MALARILPLLLVGASLGAQANPRAMGVALFLAQGMGGESGLYGSGAAVEWAWHFRPGEGVQGRLRCDLLSLASGSRKGRFGRPLNASSQALLVAYDWVFCSDSGLFGFFGLGGGVQRYHYDEVPGTMAFPDTPAQTQRETSGVGIASAGLGAALGASAEVELRYTFAKNSTAVVVGPLGEALAGYSFDPAPSHLAVGVRWRF